MIRGLRLLLLAIVLVALPSAASPARAGTVESAILGDVNAARAAAGTAALDADGGSERACAEHAAYMERNRVMTHDQQSGLSGWSSAGDWAAERSVLAYSSTGFRGNPWTSAPFHQFQVLHPWLSSTGVAVVGDYACMLTRAGRTTEIAGRPELRVGGAVPGTIPASEIADERPFTPGELLGLGSGTRTGPHLYVYAVGPERLDDVRVVDAELIRAGGERTPLRWIDAGSGRGAALVDGGAILLAPRPLEPRADYDVDVTVRAKRPGGDRLTLRKRLRMRTAPGGARAAATRRGAAPAGPAAVLDGGSTASGSPRVTVRWTRWGLRARITCTGRSICSGRLAASVPRRRGSGLEAVRWRSGDREQRITLWPGASTVRRAELRRPQRARGRAAGLTLAWGGGEVRTVRPLRRGR